MTLDKTKINSVTVDEKTGRFYKFIYDNKKISIHEMKKLFGLKDYNFNTRELMIKNNIPFHEIDLT